MLRVCSLATSALAPTPTSTWSRTYARRAAPSSASSPISGARKWSLRAVISTGWRLRRPAGAAFDGAVAGRGRSPAQCKVSADWTGAAARLVRKDSPSLTHPPHPVSGGGGGRVGWHVRLLESLPPAPQWGVRGTGHERERQAAGRALVARQPRRCLHPVAGRRPVARSF